MNKQITEDLRAKKARTDQQCFQPTCCFPKDTGKQLSEFLSEYESSGGVTIEVSFRELVPWVHGGSRASHYLHSYPAKLLPQIAHFFLANAILCPPRGAVLDPFSGSGTVALETILSGRDAYYCDVNPFARLLTKGKTTALSKAEVERAMKQVRDAYAKNQHIKTPSPDVVNLAYWYNQKTSNNLSRLKGAVKKVPNERARNFLEICFSSVARKLSRANPRFSVPVRLKKDGEPVDIVANSEQVWGHFEKTVSKSRQQVSELLKAPSLGKAILVSDNVLNLGTNWPTEGSRFGDMDLIITSPPYAGAQKYVRATSLSMGWLDQVRSSELTTIEKRTLGREHLPKEVIHNLEPTTIRAADDLIRLIASENPTRAAIASVFLNEMRCAAVQIMRALKLGGYAVVVMADNTICGRCFPTTNYTAEIFRQAGGVQVLQLKDRIVSRSLQTKRASTSSSISHEKVMIFKKAAQIDQSR